jgi:hypothetical protein
MRLTQDDDMIQALAANRSDQPFGEAILPRRSWRGRPVPDAHGAQSARDDGAVNPIAVPDHVSGRAIPRKSLGDLTRNPFGRRICCDVDPDKISAVEPDDDEGIEEVETDGRNNEQIQAAMSGAWLRKKVRHPWLGRAHRLTMYLATLDCATSNPSLSSSPWMRGAPQS